MGSCALIDGLGKKCNSTFGLNAIYLKDCGNLLAEEINICQMHSQEVLGKLMLEEQKAKLKIERLQSQLKSFNKVSYQTTNIKTDLIELKRKVKSWFDIRRDIRNRQCRICLHPLKCNCQQCKERHEGNIVSSATVFSQYGYRRETFNFHKVCGRIFFQRFGFKLLPSLTGQHTLEQSL